MELFPCPHQLFCCESFRRKISFWHDAWLGHTPLKLAFPTLYTMATYQHGSVSDFYTNSPWNMIFRRNCNEWELERTCILFQQIGTLSTRKTTCVGKAAKMVSFQSSHATLFRSIHRMQHQFGSVWRSSAPYKIQIFTWLVVKNVCLAQSNLQRRGTHIYSTCSLCEKKLKGTNHIAKLLLNCGTCFF